MDSSRSTAIMAVTPSADAAQQPRDGEAGANSGSTAAVVVGRGLAAAAAGISMYAACHGHAALGNRAIEAARGAGRAAATGLRALDEVFDIRQRLVGGSRPMVGGSAPPTVEEEDVEEDEDEEDEGHGEGEELGGAADEDDDSAAAAAAAARRAAVAERRAAVAAAESPAKRHKPRGERE